MLITPPMCLHVSAMTQMSTCHINASQFLLLDFCLVPNIFDEFEYRDIMCPPFAVGGAWQAALQVTAC